MHASKRPPQQASEAMNDLAAHIVQFARLLRRMHIKIGTGAVVSAVAAVKELGLRNPDDLETCLFAYFIQRQDQRQLFRRAFRLYWRQGLMLHASAVVRQAGDNEESLQEEALLRRLSDELLPDSLREEEQFQLELERTGSASSVESLQSKDFESMSATELQSAERMLRQLRLPVEDLPSRRFRSGSRGPRLDMRATLRSALRTEGMLSLKKQMRIKRQAPIVVLCDISGSMSVYSRMFLHFMHAVSNDRDRVHSFVFGTRLSNISRYLRYRDVDKALAATAQRVQDWSGGTRIEECLHDFNRHWSRRVLAQGALVILISDGLDRGRGVGLQKEMERLAKSSRRLVWLNPLLRFDGFEPRAAGIKAMLPYVDDFRSAHSVKSLIELGELLRESTRHIAIGMNGTDPEVPWQGFSGLAYR